MGNLFFLTSSGSTFFFNQEINAISNVLKIKIVIAGNIKGSQILLKKLRKIELPFISIINENIKNNALIITINKLPNKKLSKYFLKSNLERKSIID